MSGTDGETFGNSQFLVTTGPAFSGLDSSKSSRIIYQVEQGETVLFALNADRLAPKRTLTATTDNMIYDPKTGTVTSNQVSQETQTVENEYCLYVDAVTSDGARRTQVFDEPNHERYMQEAREQLTETLGNKIKNVQTNTGLAYASSNTVPSGDWVLKWSQEYTGYVRGDGVNDTDFYARNQLYYLPHPDDLGYEYYWIDPYIDHYVSASDYQQSYSSWVGPWVGQREYWVNVNARNQQIYKFGPQGTQSDTTFGYDLGLSFDSGGIGVQADVSSTYTIPDVTVTALVNQGAGGNTANWIETLKGPDYSWCPIYLYGPALVGHTSFYTEPSIIVRTPVNQGLVVNQLKSEADFYKDTNFQYYLLVLAWTRYHWQENIEWDNISINDPPPSTPTAPSGPSSGTTYTSYSYSTTSTEFWNDPIEYIFNWGDGTNSSSGPWSSGATASASHYWTSAGNYNVTVQAYDVSNDSVPILSAQSTPTYVSISIGTPTPAYWVVPETEIFYTNTTSVGTSFNVTVMAACPNGTDFWQVELGFNATQLHSVAAAYTAVGKSQLFSGHITLPVTPVIDNVGGSVTCNESLEGADFIPAMEASVFHVTFSITAAPTSGNLTSLIDPAFGLQPTGKTLFKLQSATSQYPDGYVDAPNTASCTYSYVKAYVVPPPVSPPAFWITPTTEMLSPSTGPLGSTFNVTVWVATEVNSFTWQVQLDFNPAQINATKAVYSAGTTSSFFAGHTTVSSTPSIDDVRGTVTLGETILGSDVVSAVPSGAALFVVTFQIIAVPPLGTIYTSTIAVDQANSYVLDPDLSTERGFSYGDCVYTNGYLIIIPDIIVTSVASPKTVVGCGYSLNVTVTTADLGTNIETFNVTVYANTTIIASQNITLSAGTFADVRLIWNTTGFAKSNYTLSAYAWPVPGETNTANNNCTGSCVIVSIPGDITGPNRYPNGKVDMWDIGYIARRFMCHPSDPLWDPNADINSDGKIDMQDIGIAARNYFQHYP